MFLKIGIAKNFANFTSLKAFNFVKKRFQYRCFPVAFAKLLRTTAASECMFHNYN